MLEILELLYFICFFSQICSKECVTAGANERPFRTRQELRSFHRVLWMDLKVGSHDGQKDSINVRNAVV